MNSSGDSSFNKSAAFNSCKNIAAIILILLGCGCSVTCLAFWVVKGAGKFISVPYFINSCSQSYFLLKYSNEGLGIAVFITTSIAAAFQGLLLIVYIFVQLKKHNSSALVKRTIQILLSLSIVALVVPCGYSLSFLIELSKAQIYSCSFTFSYDTIFLLVGLSFGSLLLTLITFIIMMTSSKDSAINQVVNKSLEVREQSQLELLPNNETNPYHQAENIFAPDIYMADKLPDKYDAVERKRKVRMRQSRNQSQSYLQMRSPKSTSKNMQIIDPERRLSTFSRSKDRANSSVTPTKQKIKTDIWSHTEAQPMEAAKIKNNKPFFREIGKDWDDRSFQLLERNDDRNERYFVPRQGFSYSKSHKTPMARSAQQQRVGGVSFDRVEMVQIRDAKSKKQQVNPALSRAVSQIRRNYERKLNSQQNWH